jgi:hypothetical protein
MEQVKSGAAAVYDSYCKKPEYKPLEAKAKAAEIVNDATGNMLNQDPVMAKILAEAEHGPAKSVDDELAALASA